MKNLSLRSEIKRKSYLKIYSLFEYLLFDHFATMGAERRLGALPPATRSGRPQWMPTHARAVIMVSSFRFQAGGDDCVPRQRSRTATRITILVSNFSAGGDDCDPNSAARLRCCRKFANNYAEIWSCRKKDVTLHAFSRKAM